MKDPSCPLCGHALDDAAIDMMRSVFANVIRGAVSVETETLRRNLLEDVQTIVAAEIGRPAKKRSERDELLAWLTHWRAEHSLPPANLRARSTAQLRSMKAEAARGAGYRVGRKWAKHG